MFDYCFAYEDRDELHTSRWALTGVSTKNGSNILNGRAWATFANSDNTVTVNVYKDPACDSGDKVATGTADVSTVPVKCALTAENSSGLTGELYIEEYTTDPTGGVEVLISLCDDDDMDEEYANLSDLHSYNSTNGMAKFCAAATRKTLLLTSQMFTEELGGFGSPPNRYHQTADHDYPRYSRIANPDQLKDAATHWALMLAFGACHQMADETMYSTLRDYHNEQRKEATARWQLAFTCDGDSACRSKSSTMIRNTRI